MIFESHRFEGVHLSDLAWRGNHGCTFARWGVG